jgi:hypothetical protein
VYGILDDHTEICEQAAADRNAAQPSEARAARVVTPALEALIRATVAAWHQAEADRAALPAGNRGLFDEEEDAHADRRQALRDDAQRALLRLAVLTEFAPVGRRTVADWTEAR